MVILIFLLSSLELFADTTNILAMHKQFQSYGERSEGTEEEQEIFDAISTHLELLGIAYERYSLDKNRRGHSFSEVIQVRIPGRLSENYILVTPVEGGAFSSALLLGMAEKFLRNPPLHTIQLYFLGGERGNTSHHPHGSRFAIEHLQDVPRKCVFYIDAEEPPKIWNILVGGNRVIAPIWLSKSFVDAINLQNLPYNLRGTDIHVASLGLQGDIGAYAPWLESGTPTLFLQGDGRIEFEQQEARINKIINSFIDVDHRIEGKMGSTEHTYVYFRPLKSMRSIFIGEFPFVIFTLVVIVFMSSIILIQYRKVLLNIKRFAPYWWNWLLLFFLLFLFLFLSTLLIEEINRLRDFPTLWLHAPGIFFFFKISSTATMIFSFILIIHGLPLPRSPHFYSYLSVVTSGTLTLVFMYLNLTLTMYSLWTTSALIMFSITPHKHQSLRRFFVLLSLLPYAMGIAVLLSQSYSVVLEYLLLDRMYGNLVNTFALLPIILSVASLYYGQPYLNRSYRVPVTPPFTLVLILFTILTFVWILRMSPFDNNNPQPVELVDHIDLIHDERQLEWDSPSTIRDAELSVGAFKYSFKELKRKFQLKTHSNRRPLTIHSTDRSFLGRRTIDVHLEGENKPFRLTMQLHSEEPFTLHAASQPFEMAPSGRTADIFIGDNPPLPFNMQLTVGGKTDLILTVHAVWLNPEDPPKIISEGTKVRTRRVVVAESIL